ncbi:MAG: valine--tRNA ligase [Anaerolineales bacterium]|uniref:valine--tRNA ligase n=1 Tax=Promineifilum sp. TaxID=2664178 RepID=UPI001DE81B43|nr:valine--tRNA ligase [Anaerolineales bacterium]MCO5178701.1 valine--tRNA ligase [Promineifilum sp.]
MTEMPKAYDFHGTEERLYQWWEENGWFKPETRPADATPFVISIPPPNVTGELHMGHVMFVALEDLMIRRARMQGRAALWVPGVDHAGIATQLQVEKLLREEGTSRAEIGREAFLRRTWAWKEKYGNYITGQLRRLGASCDWDRERFTFDDGLSAAVREAFVRLYRLGLIYQDEYLVNWSPGLQTAVSDLEVEYSQEQGLLYYFKYPVAGGGYLPVATTRPETILGDTAVAVHPNDARFTDYVGRTALVPILNREIPIIADSYVEMAFGTGALKITPGHDPNDFEIGRRHNLAIISVMNKDATMAEAAGPYTGLERFEARARLWADMEAAGLTIKTEPYTLNVPRSQRGGEIIEPLISKQWFVNTQPQAEMAMAAVHSGRITIIPDHFIKTWDNWLTNIRPWCISRQLWWGHRIPVWTCDACGHQTVATTDPTACERCASADIIQDPDVLDTWFSSALWPFSTLGWPEQTADLARFYPTDVMETGYDILFFWVARMVMAGALFTNDIPFHTIYLHGLVRDELGRKMSKSIGNVTDPLDVIQEYGADALRFTLLTAGSPGNDLNLSLERVESNRNFGNKIWNVARFITRNYERVNQQDRPEDVTAAYSPADRWILTRLAELISTTDRLMDGYLFGEAGRQIYDFLWNDFADWYVEFSKVRLIGGGAAAWTTLHVLTTVLDHSLRLLHPFIPFVTEEIWQQLRSTALESDLGIGPSEGWAEALIIADWPRPILNDAQAAADVELLRDLIRRIRNARAEQGVEPARHISALIAAGDKFDLLQSQRPLVAALARLDDGKLTIAPDIDPPAQAITLALGAITCYLPMAGLVDLDAERARLQKEDAELSGQIERLTTLLGGPFAGKAPEAVVRKEREKLAGLEAGQREIRERLTSLNGK